MYLDVLVPIHDYVIRLSIVINSFKDIFSPPLEICFRTILISTCLCLPWLFVRPNTPTPFCCVFKCPPVRSETEKKLFGFLLVN